MLFLKVISSLIVTVLCLTLTLEYPSNILTVSLSLFSSSILFLVISWNLFTILSLIHTKYFTPKLPAEGKIVLVTGCDSGFGHLTALTLNKAGFIVYATCLSLEGEGAKSLIANCAQPKNMTIVQLDISNRKEVDEVFELISDTIRNNNHPNSSFHALVNNAGISRTGELEWGDFDTHFVDVLEVNTLGAVYMIRKFLPLLRTSSDPRIVNLTSIAGKLTASGTIAYSMSKAALISLSSGLRRELEKFNIKVIEIEPMFYKTPLIEVDQVRRCLDQMWIQTPSDVRAEYGDDYFHRMKSNCISVLEGGVIINKHPEQVVDAIHESLTSRSPQTIYRCANIFNRFIYWIILTLLPLEIVDVIMKYSHVITDRHFLKKLIVKS